MASLSRFTEYLQQSTWSTLVFCMAVTIPAFLLLNSLFSKHSVSAFHVFTPLLFLISSHNHQLRHIPVVGGPSLPVFSYLGAYKFVQSGKEIFQEGYEKANLFQLSCCFRNSFSCSLREESSRLLCSSAGLSSSVDQD